MISSRTVAYLKVGRKDVMPELNPQESSNRGGFPPDQFIGSGLADPPRWPRWEKRKAPQTKLATMPLAMFLTLLVTVMAILFGGLFAKYGW